MLSELTDDFHDLGSGYAQELSESAWFLLLAMGFETTFFAEKIHLRGSLKAESDPGEDCGFYRSGAGSGVKTDEGLED